MARKIKYLPTIRIFTIREDIPTKCIYLVYLISYRYLKKTNLDVLIRYKVEVELILSGIPSIHKVS